MRTISTPICPSGIRLCGRRRTLWTLLAFAAIGLPTSIAAAQDAPPTDRFAKWEPEIRKFEVSDASKPPQAGGIVFVGSSSIRMWKLEKSFPDLPVVNRGFGGSEIEDSVHFAKRIVLPYHPKTVVFYAGDNDIKNKKTAETVAAHFREFCQVVHDHLPETKILFIGIKPCPSRWNLIGEQRKANGLIRDFCNSTDYARFVDIEPVMIGENGEPEPSLFKEDKLHMTDAGYERWTALLTPALKEAAAPRVTDAEHPLSDSRLKPQRTYNDAYHPWTPPQTKEAWEALIPKIRRQLLVACGLWPMPEKAPLKPVIHGKIERDGYTVERVFFASRPGLYVTGSLFRPTNAKGKTPGVLCPHGHWANGRFYDAGDKGAADQIKTGAESLDCGAHSPLQARMIHLARMGCTVFFYDMIGYADQKPLEHRTGFHDAEASLRLQNHLGLQTWNSIRALDFLLSLPEVDSTRIGVTGASGGGTQTFMLCALDPRPTVAFPAVMVGTAMQGGCNCENSDYLRVGINNIAIAALTAPRPLGMSGADDWTIDIETKGIPELQQIYGFYGQRDLVTAKTYKQFPHNYNEKSRELMYAWFARHLKLDGAPLKESEFKLLTTEELTVFSPEHPLPADALPVDKLRELMSREADTSLAARLPKSAEELADFREFAGGALEVMLGEAALPDAKALEPHLAECSDQTEGLVQIAGTITRKETGEIIPTVDIRPRSASGTFRGTVVLWIDGAGKAALFDETGRPSAAVQKLTKGGMGVVGIDTFLTGESAETRARQTSGQKEKSLYPVNTQFPGYTFGYNLPLVSQRTRDILAAIAFLRSQDDTKRLLLVGTGEGAVPAALARAAAGKAVDGAWIDVAGFSFDAVTKPNHPHMLPGAKKYGGLGGLAGLAAPYPVSLHGLGKADAAIARQIYAAAGNEKSLQTPESGLTEAGIADLLLAAP